MKKLFYLVLTIFSIIGALGIPYSYATTDPLEFMNEIIDNGACTSLDESVGTGFIVSPLLLTDCSLTMLWPAMINQILIDNEIIDKRIF